MNIRTRTKTKVVKKSLISLPGITIYGVAALIVFSSCGTSNGNPTDTRVDYDVPWDPYGDDPAQGCTPGAIYCQGSVSMKCANDGKSFTDQVDCATQGKICSTGFGCTVCTPGARQCDGNTPVVCSPDGSSQQRLDPCPSGAICSSGVCVSLCDEARSKNSYIGCDYWAVPTANSQLGSEFHYSIAVANPQDMQANVRVTNGGGYSNTFTVAPHSLEVFNLPYIPDLKLTFQSEASVLDPNGAYSISSDVPVTVYQFNPLEYMVNGDCSDYDPNPMDGKCYSYTNDASLLLPQHVLTGNYYVMARPTMTISYMGSITNSPGYLAVVGTSDIPTNVSITFSCRTYASSDGSIRAYSRGETGVFTLYKYNVLQIISDMPSTCINPSPPEQGYTYCNDGYEYDLTGTRITADQPVAVFSGHNCTFVPYNRWACDHLEEQMFPLETWGKEYVVTRAVPIFPRNPEPNIWKILSGKDGNVISFDPPSVNPQITLNAGEWVEFESRENFKITGTEGFMVAQFMVGMNYYGYENAAEYGDPAMCLGIPYEQYRDEYTFLTPLTYEMSWVNVTIKSGSEGGVLLDGLPVSVQWTPIGTSGFVVGTIDLVGGVHQITAPTAFGITVYGVGDYTSYMYPGGLDLEKIFII